MMPSPIEAYLLAGALIAAVISIIDDPSKERYARMFTAIVVYTLLIALWPWFLTVVGCMVRKNLKADADVP
jgi:hypothetical protein